MDRLIQQAIVLTLTPCWTRRFLLPATDFNRDAAHTMRCVRRRKYVAEGHRWVVDLDLSKFFDRVNHNILMERLARRISDKTLLRLVRRYLEAGMLQDGVVMERAEGTRRRTASPPDPAKRQLFLDKVVPGNG